MSCKMDSCYQDQENEHGHLKILIPAFAIGAIIGPRGRNVASLQEQTRTKIEMSRLHDYYPGTTERVCLISGHREAILRALAFLMKVIGEKPYTDPTPCVDHDRKIIYCRGQQVKILVPNKIASKIIGNSGKTIKDIKLISGSYIQISQTSRSMTVYERCVTVMGEYENNRFACRMILERIVGDKTMNRYLHVSYAHITHYVPNSNPTGSPVAKTCMLENNGESATESMLNSPISASNSVPFPSQNVPSSSLPTNEPAPPAVDPSRVFEILRTALRNCPFSDEALTSISNALSTLAGYGVLDLCLRILLNVNPYSESVLDNPHSTRPDSESTFRLYQPVDTNSQWNLDSRMRNLCFGNVPDQPQTTFEPLCNPPEFCFEQNFYPPDCFRNAYSGTVGNPSNEHLDCFRNAYSGTVENPSNEHLDCFRNVYSRTVGNPSNEPLTQSISGSVETSRVHFWKNSASSPICKD